MQSRHWPSCHVSMSAQRSRRHGIVYCVPRRILLWDTIKTKHLFLNDKIFGFGAGRGNRTLVFSLEGCCTTIVLYPRTKSRRKDLFGYRLPVSRRMMEMVEEAGFEPAYAKRTDLQSVSFNHSDTPPSNHHLVETI